MCNYFNFIGDTGCFPVCSTIRVLLWKGTFCSRRSKEAVWKLNNDEWILLHLFLRSLPSNVNVVLKWHLQVYSTDTIAAITHCKRCLFSFVGLKWWMLLWLVNGIGKIPANCFIAKRNLFGVYEILYWLAIGSNKIPWLF